MSPDISQTPLISVSRISPGHLATDWAGRDIAINVSVLHLTIHQAVTKLKPNISLKQLGTTKSVAIAMTTQNKSLGFNAVLKPATALAVDNDYVLEIAPTSEIKTTRRFTVFRTGKLQRIRSITFSQKSKTGSAGIGRLLIAFSESVDLAKVAQSITVLRTSGTDLRPKLTNSSGGQSTAASFDLASDLASGEKVVVSVKQSVGGARLLDGKYTGAAGSGDFSATIVASDHTAGKPWEPQVPGLTTAP